MRREKHPPQQPGPRERPMGKHPDQGIELQLQRILSLQASVDRAQARVTEYLAQMAAARDQQDRASRRLQGSGERNRIEAFTADNQAQQARITAAGTGILETEQFIGERQAEIAELTGKLSDTDLLYL